MPQPCRTYGVRVPASCVPYVPEAQLAGWGTLHVRRTRTSLGRTARTAYCVACGAPQATECASQGSHAVALAETSRELYVDSAAVCARLVAHAGGDSGREDLVYDLCGVVNHFGAAGYGHYTAFARDLFSVGGPGPWLRCDDSSVVEVPAEDVRSSAAYVLFYARRDAVAAESASAPY